MSLAALQRAQLLSRASSTEERRQYIDHLLTLPAYKDPQLTRYFADNVTLSFADFEDLQDQLVDAVLDLCEDEDERNRISGVQALARIAKVAPKWVRGNTGVLLQLLESPPGELRHVQRALHDLLDVSPSDVFSMMAEDCRGSEDETGASRRQILDFLQGAQTQRAKILESGHHVEAERVFADGFYEVMETTAIAETRQILGLLLPLSTISGRNATSHSTGKYAKALTRCLHPNSSTGLTTPLLRLWSELDKRAARLDPRWTLYFLADHGAAVVNLVVDKDDKMAREVLLSPTKSLSALRRSLDDRSQGDLNPRKLVSAFAETMLKAALRIQPVPKSATVLETVLYPIYEVVMANRSTRDAIGRSQSQALNSLGSAANRQKNEFQDRNQKEEARVWRNIRDMAELMADRDLKPMDIRPSWEVREEKSQVKAQPVPLSTNAKPPNDTAPVEGISKNDKPVHPAPVQPRATEQAVPDAGPSTSNDKPPSPSPAPIGLSIISRAKQVPTEPSRPPAAAPTALSIFAHAKRPATTSDTAAMDVDSPQPISPSTNGLSIRSAKRPAATADTTAMDVEPPQSISLSTTGLSIRSAAKRSGDAPESRSLLSRLSSGNIKRAREEGSSSGSADLAARNDNGGESSKRYRASPDSATRPEASRAPSLLSRMGMDGKQGNSNPFIQSSMSRASFNTASPSPYPSVSVASNSFTFKRSGAPATSAPMTNFSIKNRAGATSERSDPKAEEKSVQDEEEEVIIRKGRGFASRQEGGGMPAPPGLSERLKMGGRKGRELLGVDR